MQSKCHKREVFTTILDLKAQEQGPLFFNHLKKIKELFLYHNYEHFAHYFCFLSFVDGML